MDMWGSTESSKHNVYSGKWTGYPIGYKDMYKWQSLEASSKSTSLSQSSLSSCDKGDKGFNSSHSSSSKEHPDTSGWRSNNLVKQNSQSSIPSWSGSELPHSSATNSVSRATSVGDSVFDSSSSDFAKNDKVFREYQYSDMSRPARRKSLSEIMMMGPYMSKKAHEDKKTGKDKRRHRDLIVQDDEEEDYPFAKHTFIKKSDSSKGDDSGSSVSSLSHRSNSRDSIYSVGLMKQYANLKEGRAPLTNTQSVMSSTTSSFSTPNTSSFSIEENPFNQEFENLNQTFRPATKRLRPNLFLKIPVERPPLAQNQFNYSMYSFSQMPAPNQEQMLNDMGYNEARSILPERFMKSWIEKALEQQQEEYMRCVAQANIPVTCSNFQNNPYYVDDSDLPPSVSQQTSVTSTPQVGRSMDYGNGSAAMFPQKSSDNKPRRLFERAHTFSSGRQNTRQRNENVSIFDSTDSDDHGNDGNDLASVGALPLQKENSFDKLKRLLQSPYPVQYKEKSFKRSMFAANQQKSLPLFLETLSEEEEEKRRSRTPSVEGKSRPKSKMKSFLDEEQFSYAATSSEGSITSELYYNDENKLHDVSSPGQDSCESISSYFQNEEKRENKNMHVPSILVTERESNEHENFYEDIMSEKSADKCLDFDPFLPKIIEECCSSNNSERSAISRPSSPNPDNQINDCKHSREVAEIFSSPASPLVTKRDLKYIEDVAAALNKVKPDQYSRLTVHDHHDRFLSPTSSLTSPNVMSPVTVIEVNKLDNQHDSLELEEARLFDSGKSRRNSTGTVERKSKGSRHNSSGTTESQCHCGFLKRDRNISSTDTVVRQESKGCQRRRYSAPKCLKLKRFTHDGDNSSYRETTSDSENVFYEETVNNDKIMNNSCSIQTDSNSSELLPLINQSEVSNLLKTFAQSLPILANGNMFCLAQERGVQCDLNTEKQDGNNYIRLGNNPVMGNSKLILKTELQKNVDTKKDLGEFIEDGIGSETCGGAGACNITLQESLFNRNGEEAVCNKQNHFVSSIQISVKSYSEMDHKNCMSETFKTSSTNLNSTCLNITALRCLQSDYSEKQPEKANLSLKRNDSEEKESSENIQPENICFGSKNSIFNPSSSVNTIFQNNVVEATDSNGKVLNVAQESQNFKPNHKEINFENKNFEVKTERSITETRYTKFEAITDDQSSCETTENEISTLEFQIKTDVRSIVPNKTKLTKQIDRPLAQFKKVASIHPRHENILVDSNQENTNGFGDASQYKTDVAKQTKFHSDCFVFFYPILLWSDSVEKDKENIQKTPGQAGSASLGSTQKQLEINEHGITEIILHLNHKADNKVYILQPENIKIVHEEKLKSEIKNDVFHDLFRTEENAIDEVNEVTFLTTSKPFEKEEKISKLPNAEAVLVKANHSEVFKRKDKIQEKELPSRFNSLNEEENKTVEFQTLTMIDIINDNEENSYADLLTRVSSSDKQDSEGWSQKSQISDDKSADFETCRFGSQNNKSGDVEDIELDEIRLQETNDIETIETTEVRHWDTVKKIVPREITTLNTLHHDVKSHIISTRSLDFETMDSRKTILKRCIQTCFAQSFEADLSDTGHFDFDANVNEKVSHPKQDTYGTAETQSELEIYPVNCEQNLDPADQFNDVYGVYDSISSESSISTIKDSSMDTKRGSNALYQLGLQYNEDDKCYNVYGRWKFDLNNSKNNDIVNDYNILEQKIDQQGNEVTVKTVDDADSSANSIDVLTVLENDSSNPSYKSNIFCLENGGMTEKEPDDSKHSSVNTFEQVSAYKRNTTERLYPDDKVEQALKELERLYSFSDFETSDIDQNMGHSIDFFESYDSAHMQLQTHTCRNCGHSVSIDTTVSEYVNGEEVMHDYCCECSPLGMTVDMLEKRRLQRIVSSED